MGSAYAGASATSSDATFLAYNPASLSGVGSYDSSLSLAGLFPTSSATYTSTGVSAGNLTVTDGTHTAQIALLGQYVTANFKLSDDGHGGTLVVDPPVTSGNGIAPPH